MEVKIYGYGWVGKAMHSLFPDALIHDPGQNMENTQKADVAFVCVPTDLKDSFQETEVGEGRKLTKVKNLDMSIVEEVVKNAQEELIIIRSTVNPGTCDKLEKLGKNIVFMPEYLGETVAHPLLDETERKFLIMGGRPENRRKAIELFQGVYNANITIRQVSNLEAEVIKLSENRAIMYKVLQCQELYDACEANGVDYYTVRDGVYGDDPRFNLWWTFVFPDNRGANSKCLPKDVYAWSAWAQTDLTNSLLEYNERYLNGLSDNPQP